MSGTRAAGFAALGAAVCYLAGFALYGTLLGPLGYGGTGVDAAAALDLARDWRGVLEVWNLVIYAVSGFAVLVMAPVLVRVPDAREDWLARTAALIGIVWAGTTIAAATLANVALDGGLVLARTDQVAAEQMWRTLHLVEIGIGGNMELLGAGWIGLVSVTLRGTGQVPRLLATLGMTCGGLGLLSLVPVLSELAGAGFGLAAIAWFMWLGVVLLRRDGAFV